MDKKKNYSKKAGGKGLMAAISDYQRESKQKETYKPKNTPKLDPKKAKNNTSQAYGSGNNFGSMLKKDPPKAQTPPKKDPPKRQTPPKNDPPKPRTMQSNPPSLNRPGGSGTQGRQMPSNPAVGYSKPVRRNFKTQAAFLKALEVYMRRKKRGEQAANSTGKNKAKQATDGRQYGG